MATLNPYLTFDGNCREAMNFYQSCLGGELDLMTVGESPLAGQMPEQYNPQVLHGTLKTAGFEIMASDMTPEKLVNGNSNHLSLICTTEQELQMLWDKLSEGGTINQPLHTMFFGTIGVFTDKFGKRWLLEMNK